MFFAFNLEEDFSPDFFDEPVPTIATLPDGSQALHYNGHVLDLPAGTSFTLELMSGEYYVAAPGKTPKSVKGLMKLKRVRKTLGWLRVVWESLGVC